MGQAISRFLYPRNYQIHALTSKKKQIKINNTHQQDYWRPKTKELNGDVLAQQDIVVHLAGASVGRLPWTPTYKKKIIDSRVNATELLATTIRKNYEEKGSIPKLLISASACGYYGYGNEPTRKLQEGDSAGSDFLAQLCVQWEKALTSLGGLPMPVIVLRFSHILCPVDVNGFLGRLLLPLKYGLAFSLKHSKMKNQDATIKYSWIHIDDLVAFIVFLMEKYSQTKSIPKIEQNGQQIYNVATPHPTSHQEIYRLVQKKRETEHCGEKTKKSQRKIHTISIPDVLIKMSTGAMASLFLSDQQLNVGKMLHTGFQLRYPYIENALDNLLLR